MQQGPGAPPPKKKWGIGKILLITVGVVFGIGIVATMVSPPGPDSTRKSETNQTPLMNAVDCHFVKAADSSQTTYGQPFEDSQQTKIPAGKALYLQYIAKTDVRFQYNLNVDSGKTSIYFMNETDGKNAQAGIPANYCSDVSHKSVDTLVAEYFDYPVGGKPFVVVNCENAVFDCSIRIKIQMAGLA